VSKSRFPTSLCRGRHDGMDTMDTRRSASFFFALWVRWPSPTKEPSHEPPHHPQITTLNYAEQESRSTSSLGGGGSQYRPPKWPPHCPLISPSTPQRRRRQHAQIARCLRNTRDQARALHLATCTKSTYTLAVHRSGRRHDAASERPRQPRACSPHTTEQGLGHTA